MRIGRYFGIPLKMNPFFILLLIGAFYVGKLTEVAILFAIVLWHEFFHIIVAKAYGLEVTNVELLPIGGVARLEAHLQLKPEIEWIIAIVGPLSNLLLIVLALASQPYLELDQRWFDFFLQANLGMALFNLLPALPLDGGRVLRSFLVQSRGFKQATQIAVRLGQFLSLLLLFWGSYLLITSRFSGLIFFSAGIMLFLSAREEQKNASYVFMRYLAHKKQDLRLKRVLLVRDLVAMEETSLGEIFHHFQPPCYHLIWVLDLEGQIIGSLNEMELIQSLFEHGLTCKVGTLL